jgi:hypothetical protein
MFSSYTCKQLRALIKQFREHHTIKNSSKLRKAALVAELEKRFYIQDGQLYIKNGPTIEQPKVKKAKKAVVPTKVAASTAPTHVVHQQDAGAKQDGLTDGQRRYNDAVSAVAAKANYKKDSAFGKRLRGNN